MLQPHLRIDKIEKYVLLPGDPGRIDAILRFLDNPKEIKFNREYRISAGEYEGIKISAMSTGMGCPSAAIAVEELSRIGAKTLIRIGTCGGLLKDMKPGDIVIPDSAACFDGTTREYDSNIEQIEADKKVLEALTQAAKNLGIKYITGVNRTHDAFYESMKNFLKLAGKGFVTSEMECSSIFLVSKLRRLKAGAVLIVVTPEAPEDVMRDPNIPYKLIDEEEVRKGVDKAIKIVLEAIKILETNNKGE